MGAKMRPALTNGDPLDFGPADRAGLASPSIYPEVILKIPAAIDPINAGAIAADAFFQNLSYCLVQAFCLVFCDPV